MEIHKPKPVPNWRELATELGIVVLGICIALAGEQVVVEINGHRQKGGGTTVPDPKRTFP